VAFFTRTVLLSLRLREEAEALELKNAELTVLAHRDPLTGLPNRRSFELALNSAREMSAMPTRQAVLALFDLDGFKGANDSHGHPHGDACLVAIAEVLETHLPSRKSGVFRLGGDEFAAVWRSTDMEAAAELASHLCRVVARLKLKADGRTLTLSTGLTPILHELDAHTLLHQADVALYRAKERGGNCFELFDPEALEPVVPPGHRLRDIHGPQGS
jgi:diguanylate cyclase (GGDEF)-like protein